MTAELDKLIDRTWNTSLERISRKEAVVARPSLGDNIDLHVPQTRVLLLVEANPAFAAMIYNSSYASAYRNSQAIMRKLGMPADYFWKFEYWLKQRAFDTMRKVINKVFTTMISRNGEGGLDVLDVDVERIRFTLTFKDCAECAGIAAPRGICYYHAGTFSGIIASLINTRLDGFETNCHSKGDGACVFLAGRSDDPEMKTRLADYLSPGKIETKIVEGLSRSLQGQPLRAIGNMVDLGYYHLMIINSILSDPGRLSQFSFDTGVAYGAGIAPVIAEFYHESAVETMRKYYRHFYQLDVKTIDIGADIDLVLVECAEVDATLKSKELIAFLLGELQGLISNLLNRKVVYKDCWFENASLRVRLSPLV